MNKKVFTGLVILMGISIMGIIAVQLVWLNNAIKVKNELFSRSVNEALNKTVDKLEDIHNFGVVNNLVFNDSVHWNRLQKHDFDFVFDTDEDVYFEKKPEHDQKHDSGKKNRRPVRIIREYGKKGRNAVVEIQIENDTPQAGDSFSYKVKTTATADSDHIIINSEHIQPNNVVVIKKDTILTDIDSMYSVGLIKIDSVLTKIDSTNIIRPDISKRMLLKAGKLKNIANQAINEIYTWDVKEIDQSLVENTLKEELANKNIPIRFEYAILRDSNFVSKSKNDSAQIVNSAFQVELYPNDIFQKNIKLSVFFPEQGSFIYRSLSWLLMASFLFSLIILITFALSIFYILRQKKISEMKSDFINNMTHEFKTPIATISVATDSIYNDKVLSDPERIKYFAGMIKKENKRMNQQVEDILTIARLDRKDFEFNWETLNTHELIEDAILGIIIQVEKRNGTIQKELNALNPMVTTDKNHFTNIIFNLFDNAIKYSVDAPNIKISTINKSDGVLISITDNGIGMTKAVQGKIFERFYRQTSGNIHNVKGFGLGLSYVKAVLEANHGTISVQSEPGKGSKFDVFLPFIRE